MDNQEMEIKANINLLYERVLAIEASNAHLIKRLDELINILLASV